MALTADWRHRGAGVAARLATVAAVLLVALATLDLAPASAVTTRAPLDIDRLDQLNVFAVRSGEPAEVLFAAPPRLMTQTLTSDDVVATVDGTQQPIRLQRLSATDLELTVVVDTTVDEGDLRAVQSAIVELALDLPPGATMRIVDAAGTVSDPAPVPGPAIAQIRQLQARSDDDLERAVSAAQGQLADSTQDRTALLVVGRDLDRRLEPIADLPLESTVAYVVAVGMADGDDAELLGPTASGTVLTAEDVDAVLPAIDEMSVDLRNLYRAEVTVPAADARTVTLDIPAIDADTASATVALDPDSVRPVEVEPAGPAGAPADAPDDPPAGTADGADEPAGPALGRIVRMALFAGLAVAAVVLLWFAARRLKRRRSGREQQVPGAPWADDGSIPTSGIPSGVPRADRPRRTTRPIAKLSPETREALAGAHLGLRRLALASRAAADRVPDELFRFSEARASAALAGYDVPLDTALAANLSDAAGSDDIELVLRAATALSTGWQHTARRKATPPPVLEINAVLSGTTLNGSGNRPPRAVAPVRALNPLVEIGLEHIVLASRAEQHSAMVARAVTAVDVGRAARLARPFLTLSPRLLHEADRYDAALGADLSDPVQRDRWLQLLCGCVALAATDCAEHVARLDRLRSRYREQVDDPRLMPLIDLLMARPAIDPNLVQRRLSVTDDTATRLLAQAVDIGWLNPHPHLSEVMVADQVVTLFCSINNHREHDSQPV